MGRPGLQPGLWHSAKGSVGTDLLDLSRDPTTGRPALFPPGPYYLGADGQTILHDNLPAPGVVAVVPLAPAAHLLKAAPDLFHVALVIARLPDADTLAQAARVAVARAMGMLA